MSSAITIGGTEIPLYGICFWLGVLVSAGLLLALRTKRSIPWYDAAYSGVFTMIGAMIGSKGLFILVSWNEIIAAGIPWIDVIKGGFVFYGGLLGGLAGLITYVRIYKLNVYDFMDIYALAIPIGHAIGRVGCFFAGCCYGIPYDGIFSHVYTEAAGQTPLHIPLLPIQLIEASCLFLLFTVNLFLFMRAPHRRGVPLSIYICAYPIIRFVLEFFRGDRERGILLGLSTSQWVSLILLFGVVLYRLRCAGRPSPACVRHDRS
ncbi:MAG: prolipoprotein diacylglyceryl transferase [Clostridia bacterium]|nr:prolipoprotein diacylglyceryl transferase [Clostridia bacterium]